jgi:hypothetical protein
VPAMFRSTFYQNTAVVLRAFTDAEEHESKA